MYAVAVLQSNAEQACLYSLQLPVVYAAIPRVSLRPGAPEVEVHSRHIAPHSSFSSTVLSEQHEQVDVAVRYTMQAEQLRLADFGLLNPGTRSLNSWVMAHTAVYGRLSTCKPKTQ